MADPMICDEIFAALELQEVVVDTHGEFRHKADIHGSSKAVKRALGSMIEHGLVTRHRPEPNGCSDVYRPITFRLT